MTGVRYYIYGIIQGGNVRRLMSFTEEGALQFLHPPYVRPVEPSRDISVSMDEPVLVSWEAIDVDNAEKGGMSTNPNGPGRSFENARSASSNIRILLTSADFGHVTTWGTITNSVTADRFWLGNSGDGGLSEEVVLNKGVDTTFVILGSRMRNNLNRGASSGDLELQTNNGVGVTYFVYVSVDGGRDQIVGDQGGASGDFSAFSPLVRAPGRVTFTGTVPANPITNPRFLIPKKITAVVNEELRIPIVPDSVLGKTVQTINLFLTVDPNRFEAIDKDHSISGIQPFTGGELIDSTQVASIAQSAYIQGEDLRLDFIFDAPINGLTNLNGRDALAILHLLAKPTEGDSTILANIAMDNSGNRITSLFDLNTNVIPAFVPQPTLVDIIQRSRISGTVPLQARSSSSDTVTFFLREVGDLDASIDSLFELNDIDVTRTGVQVVSIGSIGSYSLKNVPAGRWILTASVLRHLTGHDTLEVLPWIDQSGIQPTLDGDGVDRTELLAGDAAGYTDETGTSLPDNFIDSADINAINRALFFLPEDPEFNTFADINRDNAINATDKTFSAANQTNNAGQLNKIRPVIPTFKQVTSKEDNREAVITLTGLPKFVTRRGEQFKIDIQAEGVQALRTYEVHLTFDPEDLEVEEVRSDISMFRYHLADMGVRV